MSQDRSELLQARLDQNYQDYLAQLREKPFDEIIKLAPEITAAQQLCGELLNTCDDDDMEFLLRFDDPLEVVRGYWESEITGYSHKGEMGHMLWEIQDRELYEKEQLAQPSEKALPSPITPDNPAKPKIPLAYPGEDVYSVLRRAIKTLKEMGQQQEAAAMAFLVFSAKNPQDALTVLSNYVEVEPPHTPKGKTNRERGKTNMSDNVVKQIAAEDLRHMNNQEGLVLQGCGGPPQEWVDGINNLLTEAGILLDGSTFHTENVTVFQHDDRTCLLFPFEDVKLDVGKLAMWRLQTHGQFGGTWLSDYVPNRLGGFIQTPPMQKPKMELVGHDSNIFSIMGRASFLLQMAGMNAENKEMVDRVTSCKDYDKALNIISEYVDTELSTPSIEPKKSQKKKGKSAYER